MRLDVVELASLPLLVVVAVVVGGGSAVSMDSALPVSLPPKTELCVDHGGNDKREFVLPASANMTSCYEACVADALCSGWVYMPRNCSFPAAPKGSAFCWLKSAWSGASPQKDCCRDSGFVRTPPPAPRPHPFPSFPVCPADTHQINVTLNPANVSHVINPLYMGCHLDLGYSHQPRALYSQLIYSASYEQGDPTGHWDPVKNPDGVGWVMFNGSVAGNAKLVDDSEDQFNSHASLMLQKTGTAAGLFGAANRGLGHEGLVFETGQLYEGYVVAKAMTSSVITVQIHDRTSDPPKVLATQDLQLAASNWSKLPFTLTPSGSTNCVGIEPGSDTTVGCPIFNNTYSPTVPMSDLTAHVCVKCGGQFLVAVSQGDVRIAFTFLQPGSWGRYGNLSVLASGVNLIRDMGVSSIRQGGTFAASADYFWKKWVPLAADEMPLVRWGRDIETGWGPFHLIDLCNALAIEPIVTTFAQPVQPQDMADFVDYCYGNESTAWGKMRIAAGHVEPYRWRYIELGNEQYNTAFVDQVQAMEERAAQLGMAKFFYYLFPSNGGLNASDYARAKALGLGDHLVVDIHDGPSGGVGLAQSMLQNFPDWGMINCETNCGDHTVHRMLEEAQDLLSFFNADLPQLLGRTGSFCFERSGYQEGGLNDQGLSFFLPNMTWLQPPGFVHAMVKDAWQANAAFATVDGCPTSCGILPCFTAHVQVSDDVTEASLYLLNVTPDPVTVSVQIHQQWKPASLAVSASQIASSYLQHANTPSSPTAISPDRINMDLSQPVQLPPQSFTVAKLTGTKA